MSDSNQEQQVPTSTPHISSAVDGRPVSLAVIDAVAAVSNRPPLPDDSTIEDAGTDPLDPLYEVIDPDALNAICQPNTDDAQSATTVVFTYCGYEVAVKSTGRITIAEE